MTNLGFIGTGHLAGFFVEGLWRARARYEVTVSPRNAFKAQELHGRFGVRIAAGNQEVVDCCDLVVVCVRPTEAQDVLQPLTFRAGQTVLSVMAGVAHAVVEKLVAPAAAAVAMMPGLANAFNCGPSVLYPVLGAARELLSLLGPVHCYDDRETFATASVMGAFSGMSMLMMADAIRWYTTNGLPPADARKLVAEILRGNGSALLARDLPADQVVCGVVTPGGITEQGRRVLDAGGSWADALDAVRHRMTGE